MTLIDSILAICLFVLILCGFIVITGKLLGYSGKIDVSINQQTEFKAKRGLKLLEVLAENNVYLPAACGGKGNCGRCKIKVVTGGGYLTSLEKLCLSDKEQSDGFRLACQIKTRENIRINLPESMLLAHSFKAELIKIENPAFKIKTLHFKLEEGEKLEFKAGQYVQITRSLPWENVIRAYSISSSPDLKNEFSLDVQLIEGGIMSSYLHGLEIGAKLEFCGPFGDMSVDAENEEIKNKTLILVAGGVGLAPMRSIVSSLINSGFKGNLVLLHGVRSRKNLYCEDEYKNLMKKHSEFEYIPVLAEPLLEDGWVEKTGLVTEVLDEWLSSNKEGLATAEAYLCGPSRMMEAASKLLINKGIAAEHIHSDPFSF
ncbi:MAG: 2Fe-2S iron-sulfur cluster binding domain-containing protein [Candidatus Riflebacteria bacterium]|nr:2Fe-2S iron-sulfur cluster binding domain-containing protein [Candidatus Riflebacteria bacterium]